MNDLTLGLILPPVFQLLKFMVEDKRYFIAGVAGCRTSIAHTLPSLLCYSGIHGLLIITVSAICARILMFFSGAELGLFLRNWWLCSLGYTKKINIAKSESIRLSFNVMTILHLYFIFTIISFYGFVSAPMSPFVRKRPQWNDVVLKEQDKAPWGEWIGVMLAFQSFVCLGMTRDARRFSHWMCDKARKGVQQLFPSTGGMSDGSKERRHAMTTKFTNGGRPSFTPWGVSNSRDRNRGTAEGLSWKRYIPWSLLLCFAEFARSPSWFDQLSTINVLLSSNMNLNQSSSVQFGTVWPLLQSLTLFSFLLAITLTFFKWPPSYHFITLRWNTSFRAIWILTDSLSLYT